MAGVVVKVKSKASGPARQETAGEGGDGSGAVSHVGDQQQKTAAHESRPDTETRPDQHPVEDGALGGLVGYGTSDEDNDNEEQDDDV